MPTNLPPKIFSHSYEFVIPEDIPWLEFPNPKGIIESLAEITIEAVFKPPEAGEYLDYVTCILSPIKNLEYYSNIDLEISGSSQYGFLVVSILLKVTYKMRAKDLIRISIFFRPCQAHTILEKSA